MANNAEKLRTKLHRELPLAHPIKEHPIDKCEEFVKKLYIDMLCVIAQYENSDTEFALNFVQRIMAGADMKEPVTDHVKNAMEITEERFGEFLRQCRENKLENIFVVDAMLISCADGKPNVKQVAMLAELTAALGFKKKQVEILSSLTAVILEQNSNEYFKIYRTIPKNDVFSFIMSAICYIKEFVSGILIDCGELVYVYSKEKTDLKKLLETMPSVFQEEDASYWGIYHCKILNRKKAVFENLIINQQIQLESGNSVTFKNCEMYSAKVINYRFLEITECVFDGRNDSTNFYFISEGIKISITNSIFRNYLSEKGRIGCRLICKEDNIYRCGYVTTNSARVENCSVIVNQCSFENIDSDKVFSNAFSSHNRNVSVKNSNFLNCTSKFLFSEWETLQNNTYTNCCDISGF